MQAESIARNDELEATATRPHQFVGVVAVGRKVQNSGRYVARHIKSAI